LNDAKFGALKDPIFAGMRYFRACIASRGLELRIIRASFSAVDDDVGNGTVGAGNANLKIGHDVEGDPKGETSLDELVESYPSSALEVDRASVLDVVGEPKSDEPFDELDDDRVLLLKTMRLLSKSKSSNWTSPDSVSDRAVTAAVC
jgi:hypothetical protein